MLSTLTVGDQFQVKAGMTTEHDVPQLIRKLAFAIEKLCYMHNVQHPSKRLAALAYETLLGLNEVT